MRGDIKPLSLDGPLVSVVIAVYQGEKLVEAAIRSALTQTHRNVEVLVIDDGSTDSTWQRLQSICDPRLKIFRQENAGAAAARNYGLSIARGEYIAFLDADDQWLPGKLTAELSVLQQHSRAAIAYSWYYAVDEAGNLLHRSPKRRYCGDVFSDLLRGNAFIIPSACLLHKEVFQRLGGFNEKLRHHEDFAFILRASRIYPAFPTCQYLTLYRQTMNGKGRGVMRDYQRSLDSAVAVAEDLADVLSDAETVQVRQAQIKALYLRFLMYGFNSHASRLICTFPGIELNGGIRDRLGWLFAKTRFNLLLPTRNVLQGFYRSLNIARTAFVARSIQRATARRAK